jgi:hypothetical protein
MTKNSINKIIVFPITVLTFTTSILGVCYYTLWSPIGYIIGRKAGLIKNDYLTYLRSLILATMLASAADYISEHDVTRGTEHFKK